MCGHCTVSFFLHEFLHRRSDLQDTFIEGSEDFDGINFCHYLLESDSKALQRVSPTRFLEFWYATFSYFRAGEFLSKGDQDYSNSLGAILNDQRPKLISDTDPLEDIFHNIGITLPVTKITKLYEPETYLNPDIWEEAFGALHDWHGFACQILEHYVDWWIEGNGLTKNDLDEQMEKSGVFDPINDITDDDWGRFYDLLPLISFSVDVLGLTQPSNPILKKVGLNFPAGVPQFLGLDLWIMRKALKYCFAHASIEELKSLSHPDSLIYLEYAANQQSNIELAIQKVASVPKNKLNDIGL